MAVSTAQYMLSTTETLIASVPDEIGSRQPVVMLQGRDAGVIYIGPSGVTAATGFLLKDRDRLVLPLNAGDALFAILGTSTSSRLDVLVAT